MAVKTERERTERVCGNDRTFVKFEYENSFAKVNVKIIVVYFF